MNINLTFMAYVLDADIVRQEMMLQNIVLHIRKSFRQRYGTQKVQSARILKKENKYV